jgi:hypothetical protein
MIKVKDKLGLLLRSGLELGLGLGLKSGTESRHLHVALTQII